MVFLKFNVDVQLRRWSALLQSNLSKLDSLKLFDFSTASFYGVKVTGGETQLIVRTGDPNDTESPSRIGKNTLRFK